MVLGGHLHHSHWGLLEGPFAAEAALVAARVALLRPVSRAFIHEGLLELLLYKGVVRV